MKNLYIPKGKILNYESLICQDIVNDGTLIVEDKIHARHISGQGVVNAGAISCRSLSASDINAAYITTGKLAAERVCASEVKVSGAAVVSCCLEAAYVVTPKLTVALSEIGEMDVKDVVNLTDKRRSIFGAVLAGFFRRLWLSLTHQIPADAECIPEQPEHNPIMRLTDEEGMKKISEMLNIDPNADLWQDFEFKRLAALYRLLKSEGYALRLAPFPVPSTRECSDFTYEDTAQDKDKKNAA